MKLSVVIPTFNRVRLLRRLLLQLAAQTSAEFEVCVVDDGSKEPVALADLRPPYALHLHRQPNAGAAAARHQGVLAAHVELILFIDDDMQIGRDFIEQHLLMHRRHGRAVVLGRILADPALPNMPLFERWHAELLDRKAESILNGALPLSGNLLFTGNASLRRDDYLAVGGFDPALQNSEDVDLGLRLEKAGVAFVFSPEAFTLHGSDHSSLEDWRRRAHRYGRFDHRVAAKHPELRHANPWRFALDLKPLMRPFVAAAILAPRAAGAAAGALARAAEFADSQGLAQPALAATTLAYAVEYFCGVREAAGSVGGSLEELIRFVGRFEKGVGAAAARAFSDLRADQAVMAAYERKYGHRNPSTQNLASDVAQKIGLQMLAGVRLMRALREGGSLLGAKIVSRLIRHLYGADIHWDADLAPGLMIVHGMGLCLSHEARVGRGCILFQNVTLGLGIDPVTRETGAPTLEENVHVGAGATLVGPITVGAGSKIMAGAVLTTSVPRNSLVETPAPAVRPRIFERRTGLRSLSKAAS